MDSDVYIFLSELFVPTELSSSSSSELVRRPLQGLSGAVQLIEKKSIMKNVKNSRKEQ